MTPITLAKFQKDMDMANVDLAMMVGVSSQVIGLWRRGELNISDFNQLKLSMIEKHYREVKEEKE